MVMSIGLDGFEFPPELCTKPLSLIGFTGLDLKNNTVHRSIWDAFSNNRRPDRAAVQFKHMASTTQFPPFKSKRNSYDWYIPKGILKRNWMHKHLNEIPAVVVVFYDLDWDDPQWNEKKLDCAARVQAIRSALEGRSTKLAVILIQQTATLPTGEDMFAADRATALCTSCELNVKSLFVLPHGDHLHGYTVRLENAIFDLAQTYYHHEARNVKAHRDLLNKTTHQYLFVRHQFKIGFLNELKQDGHTAHKHYIQAYNNLLELRMVDTNALEIKTVAGFINYKLCKLMFQLNLPRDAIAQFRKHMDLFKSRIGPKDLAFEHHAWMSKQFCVFGDIFDEAIHQGLPALQTQHPGFYYQQAAVHAAERKTVSFQYKELQTYPEPDPLSGVELLEFFGQRPWRPGKLSAEPPDPVREKLGIQALQFNEAHRVNHSMIIIGLFGNAISQFKTYRCPRMRRQLVVQMAEEYYNSQDYGKALTLLSHMLWDYRCEKWWRLISSILSRAMSCAYLSVSIQDYVLFSLEALGATITLSAENKTRIYNNLLKVLDKSVPDPEPGLSTDQIAKASELWRTTGLGEPLELTVEMNNILACVESKARFTETTYQADQHVTIEVFIRSCCPHPLQFTRLSVTINNPSYSSEFAVCENSATGDSNNPLLLFNHMEVKRFICQFLPSAQDVGKEIQIGSILLHLGSTKKRCAVLRFTGTNNEAQSNDVASHHLQHFRPSPTDRPDFDNIQHLASAEIIPRDSKLGVEIIHESPALLGEWYPVKICLVNNESHPITKVAINVSLQKSVEDHGIEQATQVCEDVNGDLISLPMLLNVNDLKESDKAEKTFFLRAHRTGDRNLMVKVVYMLNMNGTKSSCMKEQLVNIPVVKPFDVTAKFFSLKFEPITKTFVKEPFVVMPYVTCASPFPLVIKDTGVELSQQVGSVDDKVQSQLCGVSLKTGETGAEAICVTIKEPNEQPVALGVYTLLWQRGGSQGQVTSSSVTLPTVTVESAPLYVEMDLPAHGWVRTPMAVAYHVRNRTSQLLELELSMEASDAFMFAGHKQLQLRLLPESERILDYNLYPLLSGLVQLPRLCLTVTDRGDTPIRLPQLTELLDRALPTHVYVMPQGKKGNSAIAVSS